MYFGGFSGERFEADAKARIAKFHQERHREEILGNIYAKTRKKYSRMEKIEIVAEKILSHIV